MLQHTKIKSNAPVDALAVRTFCKKTKQRISCIRNTSASAQLEPRHLGSVSGRREREGRHHNSTPSSQLGSQDHTECAPTGTGSGGAFFLLSFPPPSSLDRSHALHAGGLPLQKTPPSTCAASISDLSGSHRASTCKPRSAHHVPNSTRAARARRVGAASGQALAAGLAVVSARAAIAVAARPVVVRRRHARVHDAAVTLGRRPRHARAGERAGQDGRLRLLHDDAVVASGNDRPSDQRDEEQESAQTLAALGYLIPRFRE